MCFGGRPSPPPLPEPRPTPPKPEKTAERVVVGSNRTKPAPSRPKPNVTGQQTTGETGRKRTGQRQQRAKRLGTAQLRIPLMKKNQGSSDLRY
jgi:hypothetical protein|tara:strand:+ start:371 stop:649 length:279 start_codon:yes stop_codon:yes gene_type:complete